MGFAQFLIQPNNLPITNPQQTPLKKPTQICIHPTATATRRKSLFILLLSTAAVTTNLQLQTANAVDFKMTAPDQTLEEAESGLRGHAERLLRSAENLATAVEATESERKEAQKELRKSSSFLKQDIYTIIQGKPAVERPLLRNLYSKLFNRVTDMDYAARDEDRKRVQDCLDDVVSSLREILSGL